MSFIPAVVAALAVFTVSFYPLTTEKVNEICSRLGVRRAAANAEEAREQSTLQPE